MYQEIVLSLIPLGHDFFGWGERRSFQRLKRKLASRETKVSDAMIASRLFTLVVVTLLWGGLSNTASANSMAVGAKVLPPIGFIEFCIRNPGECSEVTAMPRPVTLTPQRLTELDTVQWEVNRQVRPREDLDQYGKAEYWNYPGRFGDCEDYALEKRRRLIALRWPKSALLLASAENDSGDMHLVLVVVTSKGDYVLDNRYRRALPWESLPYKWFKRQSQYKESTWVTIL